MTAVATLLTAEEYAQLPANGRPTELVRGEIVEMNPPRSRHGQVCSQTVWILSEFSRRHDRGHVVCNDTGVITHRNPDTVRGADVSFYGYARVPKGPLPQAYLPVPPDAVFEVKSPSDSWGEVLEKVAEYLRAEVAIVCVLDPEDASICVYTRDRLVQVLKGDEELVLTGALEGFRVPVRRFFE